MKAPLFAFGAIGEGNGLLIALVLGFLFGWFLEQGGLGNARKLAGQFYFTDLTVFKVMFSAIVTAALGVFWLDRRLNEREQKHAGRDAEYNRNSVRASRRCGHA